MSRTFGKRGTDVTVMHNLYIYGKSGLEFLFGNLLAFQLEKAFSQIVLKEVFQVRFLSGCFGVDRF